MFEFIAVVIGLGACFVFAPNRNGPGSDVAAAGALFVLLPIAYFAVHMDMWPLALILVCVSAKSFWLWSRWAWLR